MLRGEWRGPVRELNARVDGAAPPAIKPTHRGMGFSLAAARAEAVAGRNGTDEQAAAVPYDPHCYLCPGNERAGGAKNPLYSSTFVFDNDFPALLPTTDADGLNEQGLRVAAAEAGICRVMCFSPRHDLSIPSMHLDALQGVLEAWCSESAALRSLPFVRYVQIFENRGALMGASNPHSTLPDLGRGTRSQ